MKKTVLLLVLTLTMLSLVACGGNENKGIDNGTDTTKGTRENPYTLEDTVVINSYGWEGNRLWGGEPIGNNIFELSNFRLEKGELNHTETVDVLVFDKKCIETCYEDGIKWKLVGDIDVTDFFNPNMQSLGFVEVIEEYTGKSPYQITYFEGTTYTEAYAFCEVVDGELKTTDETYSLVRILCFDDKLEENYVYIKLD